MISLPQQPRIVLEEANRGVYEIDGLYPGYGTTIGSAIRRVMLSSLVGAAITSIKIEDISHEFSTLSGVLEDIIEITMNLKQVHFRMHDEGPHTATLNVKGERKILARDIETPSQLEVVNPDQYIATLTDKKAELSMELTVERGLGYQPVETRSKEKVPVGTIALDAAFSPVRVVNFEVENMRVGDRTDYNRIRFHVETDGSISPREAFHQASLILVQQFDALSGAFAEKKEQRKLAEAETPQEPIAEEEVSYEDAVSKKKVEDLELGTRTANALYGAGIKTVGQILKKSEKKLREAQGLGEKGVTEIKKALGNLGFTLKQ